MNKCTSSWLSVIKSPPFSFKTMLLLAKPFVVDQYKNFVVMAVIPIGSIFVFLLFLSLDLVLIPFRRAFVINS